ncbi:DUF2914 domain-containing protein [Sorangium atrum]|uniref:DUF2914 domain-containing protein n=1 Tax=Sorangium atrum TaxID=2995308 RepID=A0ABT5BQJ7_9BACT|nr:DUF2914 domain-containing protein [Sorangium aterium]MDC0676426.1 DUF2914 domain-containing protein [Sorangium aterium]
MVLALAAAALGGAGLGCSDPSEAIARISREELPALNRLAEARPGGRAEGQASAAAAGEARPDAAQAAASGAAAEERRSDAADASPARGPARERRRRSGSAQEGRTAAGAAQGGVGEGAARAPELQVMRLVVSKGIAGREPLEPATSFASAEIDRLYAFVELSNKDQATSEISVTFTPPDGSAPLRIPLAVGAQRRFRTWAATRKARSAGLWAVTVSDAAGKELARASFTITK